jgi:hypothetical protein
MAWEETDFDVDPQQPLVTHGHARAVMWGALAVALLAIAGVVLSLVQ